MTQPASSNVGPVNPGEAINHVLKDEVRTASVLDSLRAAGWVFAHKDALTSAPAPVAAPSSEPAVAGEEVLGRIEAAFKWAWSRGAGTFLQDPNGHAEWLAYKSSLRVQPASPSSEAVDCKRCAGNGEIVTDWDEYLSPPEGSPADHATADCPDCDGIGKVEAPAATGERRNDLWNGGLFTVHDPDPSDDHSAIYLVCPENGLMVNFSCDPTPGLDAARVKWIAETLNAALRSQPQAREEAKPVAGSAADDLIDIVEGIGGIAHGTWRDEKGLRLKDTPAWAAFYVAARNTTPPAPEAEKLRIAVEALEPFASVAGEYDEREDDSFEVWKDAGPVMVREVGKALRLENFRRAAQALAALQQEGR